jgi:hypothetical protein
MAVVGWVDAEALASTWFDAPEEPELSNLLEAAFTVCLAYAPELDAGAVVPATWPLAQVMQTKHLYARSKAGNGDGIGPDGYQISTFPLVLEARNLLRPRRNPFLGVL